MGRATAAAVTFAATVIGLVFALWPAARPDEPPAAKGATLRNLTLDRVSFGQYLDRIAQSRSPYVRAQLQRRGLLVGLDFKIEGYRSKQLPLQWQLIDARSGDQIARSRDLFITPTANVDRNTWSVWIRAPRGRARRFFVELELLDDRGEVPLGRLRSARFTGT
jgi:hypothetical protein